MLITSCRVFLNRVNDDRLKAFVSIVLEGEFVVGDLKVIRGDHGLFVAMPSRRHSDGVYCDIVHPIVSELRQHITEVILEEYDKVLKSQDGQTKEDLPPRWGDGRTLVAFHDDPRDRRDGGGRIHEAYQELDRRGGKPYGSGDPMFDPTARRR